MFITISENSGQNFYRLQKSGSLLTLKLLRTLNIALNEITSLVKVLFMSFLSDQNE